MRAQRGSTLIELVVAIVIITMAGGTIIGLIAMMSRSSAETLTQSQSANIANAYLGEILSKPFGLVAGTSNDVRDYNGLAHLGAQDRFGNAVLGTAEYRIDVFVQNAALGTGGNSIAAANSLRVQVRVTDPMGDALWLTAFKTQH
jgi:type II secretory pathway pseudopilin PulG